MSSKTKNLGLFKYDTTTDGKQVFSLDKALNNNWDILDDFCGSLPVGTIVPVMGTSNYVPVGMLPCDGTLYTKTQFPSLWDNYLTGETTVLEAFNIIKGTMSVTLKGIPSTQATTFDAIFAFRTGPDITTKQDLLSGFGVYIENGVLYGNASGIDAQFTDVVISPNSIFYVRVLQDGSSITTYAGTDPDSLNASITYTSTLSTATTFSFTGTEDKCYMLSTSTINGALLCDNGTFHSMITTSDGCLSEIRITDQISLINTCTYTEYQQQLTDYGQCGMFGIDIDNETFKVPKIKDGSVLQQALSNDELGRAYNAGLPNVTGTYISDNTTSPTPPFSVESISSKTEGHESGGSQDGLVTFDLSTANAIYGASDTVQMNAVAIRYFVVVANGTINQTQMDWSQWASSLQGKANIDGTNWNSSITNIDGQWIYNQVIINDNVNKAKGTYTYDMSSYLPNDGYNYEVIVHGFLKDTSSVECTCKLTSDIFGGTTASSATSESQLVVGGYSNYASGDFIIPIGAARKLYYILGVNAGDAVYVILQGYRRIGTNQ